MRKKRTAVVLAAMIGMFSAQQAAAAAMFSDTYKTPWAEASIENLAGRGVLKGVTAKTFAPEGKLTRAEFAAILSRTANRPIKVKGFPFKDVKSSAWYYASVKKAYAMGVVKGVTTDRFDPERPITREEAAVIIAHTFNYPQEEKELPYKDRSRVSRWAKASVQAVTQKRVMGGDDGYFQPKKVLSRAEAAVLMQRVLYGSVPIASRAAERSVRVASRSADDFSQRLARKVDVLLGVPYRYGGATTSGFDCSGFTKYVYDSFGVELPRTSSEQFKAGTAVSVQEMQAGDLIFFDTGDGSISHVGIYMGDGKMAHAASGQGSVKINNIDWYLEHYRVVGVKRYI